MQVIVGVKCVDRCLAESVVSLNCVSIVVHVGDAFVSANALSISYESAATSNFAVGPAVVGGYR